MINSLGKYYGYVVYCSDNHPIGVVSANGERAAICNLTEMPKSFGRYLIAIEDKRFYSHEIREYRRYKNLGIEDKINIEDVYDNAYSATLEDFKLSEYDKIGNDNIYPF